MKAPSLGSVFASACMLVSVALASGCGTSTEDRLGKADPPKPGTRVYLTDQRAITIVNVADGSMPRRVELPKLSGGDWPFGLVRRGERLVFPGRAGDTYSIDLRLREEPTRLGASSYFVPSASERRVWLVARTKNGPRLREVSASGQVATPDGPLPGGPYGLADGAGQGVVFWTKGGGFELWNPHTRTIERTIPNAFYGSGSHDHLAWCRPADFGVLHLLDLGSGFKRRVRPPLGFQGLECPESAFSPDGRLLAVPVSSAILGKFGDFGSPRSLALVDTATGSARIVAGSKVPGGYIYIAWASDGRSVFMSGGDRRRVIVAYDLAKARARRLPLELGRFSIYGLAAS